MLLLLAGCYFPTTYGLRDDGLIPTGPEVTVHASQTGMYATNGPRPWVGGQGRFRLGPKVGLRVNVSGLGFPEAESAQTIWNGEADLLFNLGAEPEAPVTTTLSLGASALGYGRVQDDGELEFIAAPGIQAGLTVSRTVAETFHPYAGVRLNPVGHFMSETTGDLWLNGGLGLSWRPRFGPRTEGVFGLEGTGAYGVNACYDLTKDDEGRLDVFRTGCGSINVALYAGVTFGRDGG